MLCTFGIGTAISQPKTLNAHNHASFPCSFESAQSWTALPPRPSPVCQFLSLFQLPFFPPLGVVSLSFSTFLSLWIWIPLMGPFPPRPRPPRHHELEALSNPKAFAANFAWRRVWSSIAVVVADASSKAKISRYLAALQFPSMMLPDGTQVPAAELIQHRGYQEHFPHCWK